MASMSGWALDPSTMAWADIAAYLTAIVAVLATITVLLFLGRATRGACLALALAVLFPVAMSFGHTQPTTEIDPRRPGSTVEVDGLPHP